MSDHIITKSALTVYDVGWQLALPLLRRNKRLAAGYRQRALLDLPPAADIWIQAASVGESFLAWELLQSLQLPESCGFLLTTNTSQGMEILEKAAADVHRHAGFRNIRLAYFPFDRPRLMNRAIARIRPRIMVLLESEMWPGHLAALKNAGVPVVLVNGRITARSLRRYRLWPSLWRRLRPDRILAVSEDDARRFGELFGPERIDVMPNIKFDRLKTNPTESESGIRRLSTFMPADRPLLVLGSVRQQEEHAVGQIIRTVRHRHPRTITALFPRHQHRLAAWRSFLEKHRLPWLLRSRAEKPLEGGEIVLWDTFGELMPAYHLATAAFVGGTLAPLKGHNFLEPLTSGLKPVIGPFWETFQWVGHEIMQLGLVREVSNWREAADTLCRDIAQPAPKEQVRRQARQYIQSRQGGTAIACKLIERILQSAPTATHSIPPHPE